MCVGCDALRIFYRRKMSDTHDNQTRRNAIQLRLKDIKAGFTGASGKSNHIEFGNWKILPKYTNVTMRVSLRDNS